MNTKSVTLFLFIAAACTKPASDARETSTFGTPDLEIAHEFSTISSVAELGDGRVVIVDGDDEVWLADPATRQAVQLGRKGDGPAEHRYVSRAFAIGPDTVVFDDMSNARFLVFTAGALSGTPIHVDVNAINAGPSAVDRAGRVYAQEPTFRHDSVAVVRWDPRTRRVDTLAYSMTGQSASKSETHGNEVTMSVCDGPHPLGDIWDAFPDGTVMVARNANYHVEAWSPDGHHTIGTPVAYEPIPTPSAERKGPCASPSKYLQPFFGRSHSAPHASPDGLFWVRRTTARESDPETYDLFSRSAKFVRQVQLPLHTRLAGFGPAHLYLTHVDDSGIERLQRFAAPQQ